MSETVKSSIFVGLAVVLVAIAGYVQYSGTWTETMSKPITVLFPELDPQAIAGMEIVRFDTASTRMDRFEVKQQNGVWTIPSRNNYPADAQTTHLAEAATSLGAAQVLGDPVTNDPSKHNEYEVIEPTAANVIKGGLGTKVILTSADGSQLAQLIIGKPQDTDPNVRYVRFPEQDPVYVAKIDVSALTTNLQDWIEADLLKIATLDISSIVINDYTWNEATKSESPQDLMKFTYNLELPLGQRWELVNARPGEKVLQDKMDGMAAALKQMRIVDVVPKPAELAALLKGTAPSMISPQTISDMASRGFFIKGQELFSNEGEVLVAMNDGVNYRIQFGEIAANPGGLSDITGSASPANTRKQLNRYVFINAYYNENFLVPPEMPEILKAAGAAGANGEQAAGDQSADLESQKRQAQVKYNAQLKEFEQKQESARKRAKELAARFADWYYVISDDVFHEIKVSRSDVTEFQVINQPGYDLDDLNRLRRQGVDGAPGGR